MRRLSAVLTFALLASSCSDDGGNPAVDARTDALPPIDAIDAPQPIDATDAPPPIDAVDAMPATAVCTVTPGDGRKVLMGTVLTPTGLVANDQVAISATGAITCVGPSCMQGGETLIACP